MTKQSNYTLENIILSIAYFTIIAIMITPSAYLLCFIVAPQIFHILFSPPLNIITHEHVIMNIVCYTIADMVLLYGIGIIITYYHDNDLKKLKIPTLICFHRNELSIKIPTLIPSYILQVISLLSGVPIIAHHLGYSIPSYIGITTYATINAIIAYIPKYTYNHVATHTKFNNIFQRLSAHAQIETMRQFGIKKSTNIHISYKQKQKFIEHHETKSIPGYIPTI